MPVLIAVTKKERKPAKKIFENYILQDKADMLIFSQALIGSVIEKVDDLFNSELTSIAPLCAWIIFKVEANPRPMPFRLEV